MELTKLILMVLGLVGVAILIPMILLGITSITGNENTPPELEIGGGNPISTGMLVQGTACEKNEDCVYALNAFPFLRCVSPNCPPEDQSQPEMGDPAYEWMDAFRDECVNAAEMGNQNAKGEELMMDTRAYSCACEAYQSGDGSITSLDGQKLCMKKAIE